MYRLCQPIRKARDLSTQSLQLGLGSPYQECVIVKKKEIHKASLIILVDLHVFKQEQHFIIIFKIHFPSDFSWNVCRGYSVGCYIYNYFHLGFFDMANLSGYL